MARIAFTTLVLFPLLACNGAPADSVPDLPTRAERFFRGVYGCGPEVVAELATEDVVISYPIFEELFGTPALRGRERVEEFARGFCQRWRDAEIMIHDVVVGSDEVALMWSFRAYNVASGAEAGWGGISLFRFDEAGRISAEIGEESEPGPFERTAEPPAGGADSA